MLINFLSRLPGVRAKADSLALLAGLTAAAVVAGVFAWVDSSNNARFRAGERAIVVEYLSNVHGTIEKEINSHLGLIGAFEGLIHSAPRITEPLFAKFAKILVKDRPAIRQVQLSPQAIIRFLYPTVPGDTARGLNLRSLPGQRAAVEQTIADGRLRTVGPLDLVQGGVGIIARKPIYKSDGSRRKFWGFVTIILDYPGLLNLFGDVLDDPRFDVAIWRANGEVDDGMVLYGPVELKSRRDALIANINMPGAIWNITALPHGGWSQVDPLCWIIRLLGVVFAVILGLFSWSAVKRYFDLESRAAELLKASEELTRSNRDLENFAYVASHDLKAPLRNIDNLAQWIEEDLGEEIKGDVKQHLTMLRQRVSRLERLLDDLLRYARAGWEEGKITSVDTRKLIDEITGLLRPSDSITVRTIGDLPRFDTADGPLSQIFRNLIDNAIKHRDRDTGCIEVSSKDSGKFFTFTVEDDGPGIDPKFHEKVFKMFQTLRPRDEVEGSGMGLAMVRKLVERHGGKIRLISRAGARGAAFEFDWPKRMTG